MWCRLCVDALTMTDNALCPADAGPWLHNTDVSALPSVRRVNGLDWSIDEFGMLSEHFHKHDARAYSGAEICQHAIRRSAKL